MKLNCEKIKELNPKDILQIILPIVDNIYKKVEYIEIPKDEFYALVIDNIMDSKITYNGTISYEKYIKNKIDLSLSFQIKKYLLIPEKSYIIINNYINTYLSLGLTINDSIQEIKKLDNFFEKYDYIPDPDMLLKITKNNQKFSRMIQLIIGENTKQVEIDHLAKISDDNTLILVVEIYCMLNNIKFKESEMDSEIDLKEDAAEVTSSLKMYLKEISRRPLLSLEEEQELAKQISEGNEEAKNIFIESNLRLVISVAKKYIGRGLSFLDLIQEGNIGLMTAVNKYDLSKGVKFSSYAVWWIRQSIQRAVEDKGRNIRIPSYMSREISKYKKAVSTLELKLNREPTVNEIASEMNISITEATKLNKLQIDTVSINKLVGDEEDNELEDFISSTEETLEEKVITSTMQEKVRELLEKELTSKEADVLILRFGLNDGKPLSLREIGERLNISPEGVRKNETRALMKLRKSDSIKTFVEYMDVPFEALEQLDNFRKLYKETGDTTKKFLKKRKKSDVQRKIKTIYDHFEDYSKEQIDTVLENLSEEEKELIVARYGEDLNNPVPSKQLSKKQSDKFYNVLIPKIRKILNSQNSASKKETKEVESENILSNQETANLTKSSLKDKSVIKEEKRVDTQKKHPPKIKSFYEYFNDYSKEQINIILKNLSEKEKSLIITMYGKDLSNPVPARLSYEQTIDFCKVLIPKIRDLLDNQNINIKSKKIRSIYEYFKDYPKEQIDTVLENLSEEEKELIVARYGEDLNNPVSGKLNKEQINKFYNILIPKIRRLLAGPNKRSQKRKTIYEYFNGYSKEQIDTVLENLSKEDQALLRGRYGDDLNNPVPSKLNKKQLNKFYNNLILKINKLLASQSSTIKTKENILNNEESNNSTKSFLKEENDNNEKGERIDMTKRTTKKIRSIYEYFDSYSKEQIDNVLKNLTKDEQALLRARYGEDLNNPVPGKLSLTQQQKFYSGLIAKIRRRLSKQNTEVRKNNEKIKPEEKAVVENTAENCNKQDITNKENVPIKQDIKVMSEDDYTEMLELLRTPIFEQTINTLSIKESAIVALKLGYIDGKCFSDEYIAEFLKIEKTEIKEITKKVLLLYKENLNKFVDHAIETVTEQPRKLSKKIK